MPSKCDLCDRPSKARGLCNGHYRKAYREGTLPPLKQPRCLVEGCFKFSNSVNGLCRDHRPHWKRLRNEIGWEERWVYPTKPWLPVEESDSGVVHVEAWLRHGSGATLTAACKPSLLLVSKAVEAPRPCGRCVKLLREHGLVA